jgi:ubiquinone biosynthesis protein UbiJ
MLPILPFPAPSAVCARALNKLLQREPWAQGRLGRHAGKTVRFVVAALSLNLTIDVQGTVQAADPGIVPDVTLTISRDKLSDLVATLRQGDAESIAAIMHVQGDAGLATVVSELARDLRWDVEDELSGIVGDVAALRLLSGARALFGGLRTSANRAVHNLSEYASEESGMLVSRSAYELWVEQLSPFERRLEALEERVTRLGGKPGINRSFSASSGARGRSAEASAASRVRGR